MAKLASIINTIGESAEFTPAGTVFTIATVSGTARVMVKLPGETDWLYVSDVLNGQSVPSNYNAGTVVATAVEIAGSTYKMTATNGTPVTAQAWE